MYCDRETLNLASMEVGAAALWNSQGHKIGCFCVTSRPRGHTKKPPSYLRGFL